MMRRSAVDLHRGGKVRMHIHKDPALTLSKSEGGHNTMKRIGVNPIKTKGWRNSGSPHAVPQYQHAWPLLTHDDLGHHEHSGKTHHVELGSYMPKRNKGLAPWFRGADTYSVKYTEQGRYEYQRYLMIARFPSDYKKHFRRFLNNIRTAPNAHFMIPQEALHWLQRMIVDNFNPQHVHYIAAMQSLMESKEYDMARDVWKIMERQQTWPCDKTIACYLDVCGAAGERDWALECWNRYCTEKQFLAEGDADPKPVTRVPFSLTRDELLYLPKWKKHFDHDPNLDVVDLNRFNSTRNLYLKMAKVCFASGELALFNKFYDELEAKLLSTPTPVPEPPAPHITSAPRWGPNERSDNYNLSPWRPADELRAKALGPTTTTIDEMQARYHSNAQFLVLAAKDIIGIAASSSSTSSDVAEEKALVEKLLARLVSKLGKKQFACMQTEALFTTVLRFYRKRCGLGGKQLHSKIETLLSEKSSEADSKEVIHSAMYVETLKGFRDESAIVDPDTRQRRAGFDPRTVVASMSAVIREMTARSTVVWAADTHLAVLQVLVNCGTMTANDYFVKNVLRKFSWDSRFLEALYDEYRKHDDIDKWAELTKRSLVWSARYDVEVSEKLKRAVEEDYSVIGVQVRTFRELAVFQFRDVEEKRVARNPVNQLPNPWTDYVSHALPFPDRDTGYPDEYGNIGQWRAPVGATKGPGYYAPPMSGEHQKGYTAEWRDPKNPMRAPPFPNPWERKYKQYSRGQHPSYDMAYAGPFPEVFPGRVNFRKNTRWDYHDVEQQSKFKITGPF